MVDGKEVAYPVNQEIVTIRKRYAGEYIVNLYYYKAETAPPLKVQVKVDQINPRFQTVFVETVEFKAQDEEITAVRFSIGEDGTVSGFNKLPLKLTPYGLDHIPVDVWNN